MSLVNDALKKARIEAARGDMANRSVPYPALGSGDQRSSRGWIAGFGALLLLAAVSGFFLFRAGKQSALRADLAIAAPGTSTTSSASAIPAPEAPASADRATLPADTASGNSDQLDSPPSGGRDRVASTPARDSGKQASASAPQERTRPAASRFEADGRVEAVPGNTATPPRPAPKNPPAPTPRANTASGGADLPKDTTSKPSRRPAIAKSQAAPPRPESAPPPASAPEYLRSADIPGVGPIELGGIAWSGDRPFALLNGRVLRPGDSILGLVIEEIQPNTVRLRGESGALVFKLK